MILLLPTLFVATVLPLASEAAECLPSVKVVALNQPIRLPVEPDSNTPYYFGKKDGQKQIRIFVSTWDGENSRTRNVVLYGTNLQDLKEAPIDVGTPSNQRNLHWIEGLYGTLSGHIMGWYHSEEDQACDNGRHFKDGYAPEGKRVPKLGVILSKDHGHTWKEGGIVLSAAEGTTDCSKKESVFFAGGVGDPYVIPDQKREFFYLFFGNYSMDRKARQGVSVARLSALDFGHQVERTSKGMTSRWKKYFNGQWVGEGLGGRSTPIFPLHDEVNHGYLDRQPDAFWGPAVYFDHRTNYYVMLLNRTQGRDGWGPEGAYISYNRDVADPTGWSTPQKLAVRPESLGWYPELIHDDDSSIPYTELNGTGLLFQRGVAYYRLHFEMPDGCF